MNKPVFTDRLPLKAFLTDDPLRARMLAAHHLEYSELIYEQGDVLIYSGSYNDTPLAVISAGFGSGEVLPVLEMIGNLGTKKVIYISACVSTTARYGLRTVVLAKGGSDDLQSCAQAAAAQYDITVITETVQPPGSDNAEGGITDVVTGVLYETARTENIKALSVLTVSENKVTGEKMEEHEVRSRFYAASRLTFETAVLM